MDAPTAPYGNMWQLELALTAAVGGILVAVLLMCYLYVFRQLCCPAPRRRRHGRRGKTANERLATPNERIRQESVPMTNITSQPTEIERV